MNRTEVRTTLALASVFSLRMFGLFLVLPVFVLYADTLAGATPLLAGIALGAYGLTQGLLQIPFGWASDRFGRKPLMVFGLALFALGSVIAAIAPDIVWTIVGRAVQGAGAIAAVITALLADLTRDEVRTRAMAAIGIAIGASFALALVAGPVLDAWIGVRGIFWLTAALAIAGIVIVTWGVPAEPDKAVGAAPLRRELWKALTDPSLRPLHAGIFVLHFALTAAFVALPPALAAFEIPHGRVYLPVLVASVLLMAPAVWLADRDRWREPLFLAALVVLALAFVALATGHGAFWPLVGALVAFFTAFNFLEAHLPAAVSRAAPAAGRGAALGVYSSGQFLGAFAGGAAGGAAYGFGGSAAVFWVVAAAVTAWFVMAAGTRRPAPGRAAGGAGA